MQLSHLSPRLLAASAAICLGFMATPAMATSTFSAVSDTNFSYTGTVTDPNGVAHSIIPYVSSPDSTIYTGRDLSLYTGNTLGTNPNYVNDTQITTNWYSSSNGLSNGIGNPNNINSGFVQLVTDGNTSVTSMSGGWTNSSYTTFVMSISGGPTTTADNRLWAAPHTDGAVITTDGQFQNYTFYLTTTFAPGAVTQESPGWFSTTTSPQSITGGFSGNFVNTGSLAPGQYGFNFTFLDTNWADANGIAGFSYPGGSYFGASTASAVVVPEPPTLVLFGLFGVAAFGLRSLARRKRCS